MIVSVFYTSLYKLANNVLHNSIINHYLVTYTATMQLCKLEIAANHGTKILN